MIGWMYLNISMRNGLILLLVLSKDSDFRFIPNGIHIYTYIEMGCLPFDKLEWENFAQLCIGTSRNKRLVS